MPNDENATPDNPNNPANEDATPDTPNNPVDWVWSILFQNRIGRIIIVLFAIVTVISTFGDGLGKISNFANVTSKYFEYYNWAKKPTIIYIYPDAEFGVLRKKGFERGIHNAENQNKVHTKYIPVPFDELKKGKISSIETILTNQIQKKTVAAIVSPSITEATEPIVNLVRSLDKNIPILIESSIDSDEINWEEDKHLFRLSSGVDARGREIGYVIETLVQKGRSVSIIAEKEPTSYGGKMLRYASSPIVSQVPEFRYTPNSIKSDLDVVISQHDKFEDLNNDAIKKLQDPENVVFFLGLGSDFAEFVKRFYQNESSLKAKAKLIGVMVSYKLIGFYEENPDNVDASLIFEITDFDFILPFKPTEELVGFKSQFSPKKAVSPAIRDQAYSFDGADLLGKAIAEASGKAKSYSDGLEIINEYLHNYSGRGVTGNIVIKKNSPNSKNPATIPSGQNIGSTILRLSTYQKDIETWVISNADSL